MGCSLLPSSLHMNLGPQSLLMRSTSWSGSALTSWFGSAGTLNAGTLASVMHAAAAMDAMMANARYDNSSAPGWPHLLNAFGEADFPAAAVTQPAVALPPDMAQLYSLAAVGHQQSAPPLMQR